MDHQVLDSAAPAAAVDVSTLVSVTTGVARSRRGGGHGSVGRLAFHLVVIPTTGRATYTVDFVDHIVGPGRVLHVHPGQVVRPPDDPKFRADVACIAPSLTPAGLFDGVVADNLLDPGPATTAIRAVVGDIAREQREHKPDPAMLTAAAHYLLLRLASTMAVCDQPSSRQQLLRAFRAELERSYFATRAVSHYAAAIGASPKTLSRTTAALAGSSPKEIIDHRVVLEARRLLALTTYSASSIGAMLGFSEPTNFTKFFARHTGASPQEFRVTIE